MKHDDVDESSRLERLLKWAVAYRQRAMQVGKRARALRAARFETALESRLIAFALGACTRYSDYS